MTSTANDKQKKNSKARDRSQMKYQVIPLEVNILYIVDKGNPDRNGV